MPATRTSRNGHESNSTTTARRSPRRSHSTGAETNRHVIRPAKRAVRNVTSTLPGWVPWAIGGVGVCAIVYGLLQIESVRNYLSEAFEPVGDFLSGEEFEGYEYAPRDYEN